MTPTTSDCFVATTINLSMLINDHGFELAMTLRLSEQGEVSSPAWEGIPLTPTLYRKIPAASRSWWEFEFEKEGEISKMGVAKLKVAKR